MKLNLSPTTTNNLKLLMERMLQVNAANFSMQHFCLTEDLLYTDEPPSLAQELFNSCTTVCCLAGHAAVAGIGNTHFSNWNAYILDTFPELAAEKTTIAVFTHAPFLFAGLWPSDIAEAIGRIDYVLTNDSIPESYNFDDSFLNGIHKPAF